MKKRMLIGGAITGLVLVGGLVVLKNRTALKETSWKTVEVTRKPVENLISSTGTLKPVGTVEVGTQVSGTVVSVSADYNDVVKKNQIIAELDRQPLQIKLTQVQAGYLRNEALFEQARSVYERDKLLHDKELISDEEFSSTKTNYLAQKASLEGAKADVETARTNLTYATIRSPVDGTVIKRSVDVGQTVAASLSAPTLFLIAEDLKQMEILADVDESDIGRIKTGQAVSFNVPAFPELTYKGLVSQIRLQPQTSQNVVTYSVVVKVENADGALLPGMTANVDFVVERVENELTIPAAALRFKPSDDIIARFEAKQQEKDKGENQDSGNVDASGGAKGGEIGAGEGRAARGAGGEGRAGGADRAARMAARMASGEGRAALGEGGGNQKPSISKSAQTRGTIWILDDMNEIKPVVVQLGLSDGSITVIRGRGIEEGVKVVTGVEDKKQEDATTKSRNPFMPSRPPSQGGRGGGFHG